MAVVFVAGADDLDGQIVTHLYTIIIFEWSGCTEITEHISVSREPCVFRLVA